MNSVRVRIPATTANLGPGFDTLGLALTLYNFVKIEFSSSLKIGISGEGAATLPRDETNLVYRVAQEVIKKGSGRERKLKVKLENNIPLKRGLGSSATALLGGAFGANTLIGNKFSPEELLSLCLKYEKHPDNLSAAYYGGLTVASIKNAKIIAQKFKLQPSLKIVVVVPEFELSTPKARAVLPKEIPFKDACFNLMNGLALLASLIKKDFKKLSFFIEDKLHQPYRKLLIPGLEDVFRAARRNGAYGVALSGAGPSVVAFTSQKVQAKVKRAMMESFSFHQIKSRSYLLSPDLEGLKVD